MLFQFKSASLECINLQIFWILFNELKIYFISKKYNKGLSFYKGYSIAI